MLNFSTRSDSAISVTLSSSSSSRVLEGEKRGEGGGEGKEGWDREGRVGEGDDSGYQKKESRGRWEDGRMKGRGRSKKG